MKVLKVLFLALVFNASLYQAGAMMRKDDDNNNNNNNNNNINKKIENDENKESFRKLMIGDEEKAQRQQKLVEMRKEVEAQLRLRGKNILELGDPGKPLFNNVRSEILRFYQSERAGIVLDDKDYARQKEMRISEIIFALQDDHLLTKMLGHRDEKEQFADGSLKPLGFYNGVQFILDLLDHVTLGTPDVQAAMYANRIQNLQLFDLSLRGVNTNLNQATQRLQVVEARLKAAEEALQRKERDLNNVNEAMKKRDQDIENFFQIPNKQNNNNNNNNNIINNQNKNNNNNDGMVKPHILRRDDDDIKQQPQEKLSETEIMKEYQNLQDKRKFYSESVDFWQESCKRVQDKIAEFDKFFKRLHVPSMVHFDLLRPFYPDVQGARSVIIDMKGKNLYGNLSLDSNLKEQKAALEVLRQSNLQDKKELIERQEFLIKNTSEISDFLKLPEALRKASLLKDIRGYFHELYMAILGNPEEKNKRKSAFEEESFRKFFRDEHVNDFSNVVFECSMVETNVGSLAKNRKELENVKKTLNDYEERLKEFRARHEI